ncbi:hypothetical protein JNB63_04975 [Microbacterium trichothecenolyticum]|nr:hypothetical protein [Microbacterium trichothecenolyticum]MBW9119440.1 hypothetical protein [Microbacterium trichothecenolyticum]
MASTADDDDIVLKTHDFNFPILRMATALEYPVFSGEILTVFAGPVAVR